MNVSRLCNNRLIIKRQAIQGLAKKAYNFIKLNFYTEIQTVWRRVKL